VNLNIRRPLILTISLFIFVASVPHFQLSTFLRRLPRNTTVVPEIKRFHSNSSAESISQCHIVLVNGTVITGIDRIIFATGFRYSFPFMPLYHNSSIGINESATGGALQPLVTDGTHIRSLHLDLFYIEEPTIGFINMNLGMQSFTYAEYLSLALAKVWANKAKLPPTKEMWRLYQDRLEDYGGYGKHFQFLGTQRTEANVRCFVAWLNDAAVKFGGRQINGLPAGQDEIRTLYATARFGKDIFEGGTATNLDSAILGAAFGIDRYFSPIYAEAGSAQREILDDKRRESILDSIFGDFW